MAAHSRREFARRVIVGVPALAVLGRTGRAAARVSVGVSGASFRNLPRIEGKDNLDDVMRAMRTVGVTSLELALSTVEPAPPPTAPVMGGTPAYPRLIVPSPEEVAATNKVARAALRAWRASAAPSVFDEVRRKLAAAGVSVPVCAVSYNDSFTDDELDATMRQVKAMGATAIASPLTLATATRLAPFAARHQMSVAIHTQPESNTAGALTSRTVGQALELSEAFTVKLDIGHITASNGDPVADLRAFLPRVSQVVIRDRLRNGGASQPLGEGDTPIAAVLDVMKGAARPVPAFVEYDYVGLRPVADEVAIAVAFVRKLAE